jgi:GNAT superfamily N-acetyltransferase
MPEFSVNEADLNDPETARDIVAMTAAYAEDAWGNGGALPPDVLENLVEALRRHPTTIVFLARADGRAVGIATCFLGFSTFAARPLINVHDLFVAPEHRGAGIGRALLDAVSDKARSLSCAKVTLEVYENNPARRLYEAAGFSQPGSGEPAGGTLFYTKPL